LYYTIIINLINAADPRRVKARKENDWPSFAPVLQEMVALKAEVAAATRPEMGTYDGERGMCVCRRCTILAPCLSWKTSDATVWFKALVYDDWISYCVANNGVGLAT
jgi:hypothetical protein